MRFLIYSAIKMNFQDNSQSNSGVLIQWNYAPYHDGFREARGEALNVQMAFQYFYTEP